MLKYLIRNTFIIDGTGAQGFMGSVGVENDKIAFISKDPMIDAAAENVIDGTGLVTCPGFIDPHSHADLALPQEPEAESFLLQGITTYVGGHCGLAKTPADNVEFMKTFNNGAYYEKDHTYPTFEDWLSTCAPNGTGPNYAPLAADGSIRGAVLGKDYTRISTPQEKIEIKERLREALDAGAFGLSVSYDVAVPGHWADDEEIISLLELVRDYDGIFAPHTRHHQHNWFANHNKECAYGVFVDYPGEMFTGRMHGLWEPVEYTKRVKGLRTMISHMTPIYHIPQPHPAYVNEAMARAAIEEIVENPRRAGLDITYNFIPCDYSVGTTMRILDMFFHKRQTSLWPDFYRETGKENFVKALAERDFRDKVTQYINSGRFKFYMVCPGTDPYWSDSFTITKCAQKEYIGQTVYDIACMRAPFKRTQAIYREALEVLYDILEADPEAICAFTKDKREYASIAYYMKNSVAMPCTDSHGSPASMPANYDHDNPGRSPSTYSMFPSYLIKTVKEEKVLDLPEAIRKATSLPASVVGINNRGILKRGNFADLVVMDWENLQAYHDFLHPNKGVDGICYVFVNGEIACENKMIKNAHAGRILRKERG